MARRLISSGSSFEKVAGYSRAVVEDGWIFVSGTTGFDYRSGAISEDVVEQTERCLENIAIALKQAGGSLDDVVRIRVYLAATQDFARVAPVLGRHFGSIRPANTAVVTGFVDPRIKIEIEATARHSPRGAPAEADEDDSVGYGESGDGGEG